MTLAKSLQAAAGNAGGDALYVDDVFSTYLYTGNGSTQTITNGIDLSGEGGLVWVKYRGNLGHVLVDTERGASKYLISSSTSGEITNTQTVTGFTSSGFSVGNDNDVNTYPASTTYASWTFRKAQKWFDVVTYSGNDVVGRTVPHSLGSAPGVMIIKSYNQNGSWWIVYHRSLGAANYLQLSATAASAASSNTFNNTGPTDTVFTLGASTHTNASGYNYVAYLFAHDAGGFGADGSENVISCGSYTGTGAKGLTINLGFEPQWLMVKRTDAAGHSWMIYDSMRGFVVLDDTQGGGAQLNANLSNAEAIDQRFAPTATGFELKSTGASVNASGGTYIYIAIRRPMKPPTVGTEVFSPQLEGGTTGTKITTGFPIDWQLIKGRSSTQTTYGITRLTGVSSTTTEAAGNLLQTASTAAELADSTATRYWDNTGFQVPSGFTGGSSTFYITENFRRASGFFDVVCYSGNSVSNQAQNHNLGVVPELYILKCRSSAQAAGWLAYTTLIDGSLDYLTLNSTAAKTDSTLIAPTSTQFYLSNQNAINGSGFTYVGYFFASVPGVSKVGTYTGNGSSQTINCGFTSGARFVLIKRTDSTGDWYVWDSARGIVAGNDPHLSLNTTAAEVTTDDSVDATSSGFIVNQLAATNINVTSATYIFLSVS